MSSLVLDPLQRITRSEFHGGTTAVVAFCEHTYGSSYYCEEAHGSLQPEDVGTGPYMVGPRKDAIRTMPWWFDDVQRWKFVYERIGLKGVAFELPDNWPPPSIVPVGEEAPEGVTVVPVSYPLSIDKLTQPEFRPAVANRFAPGVDPRFYIFVRGRADADDLHPRFSWYLSRIREWRVPYRVIEVTRPAWEDQPTGLGGRQWLQWLYAPFMGGFNLGADVAYEDWTP